jgi:Domain of unknown function (DUF6456)
MDGASAGSEAWAVFAVQLNIPSQIWATSARSKMSENSSERPHQRPADSACPATPGFNADESPLGWLSRHKSRDGKPLLSDAEIAAGEKLRADFWFAQMTPHTTANWSNFLSQSDGRQGSPDHGAEMADHVVAARERVRLALRAAGPELSGLLIDVCCHLKGLAGVEKSLRWPQRSARIVLTIALRQLARHYGFISDPDKVRAPGRVTHWGAEGYKPRSGGKGV